MNPTKVNRDRLVRLTDLPNVGPAVARDLELLGILRPSDLMGRDAQALFQELCRKTGTLHDRCMIDVFESVVRFLAGEAPQPWWVYTPERKAQGHSWGSSPASGS